MLVRTVSVPASGFSTVLSLLGLNISTPIGIAFSKALTASDIFNVYGTLDSAAADATNATSIGRVAGSAGGNLDPELVQKMLLWPYVILQRVAGAGAGNLELCGNQDTAPAVVSAALPAIGAYTTLMDLTAFGATVRIGTSRQQTISDVFDVYVANDSTINPAVTATAGAFYAGRIAGGGEASGLLASIVVQGFGYAFLKRVSGATAGNALAAGASEPATSGGEGTFLNTVPIADLPTGGVIGTAATTVDLYQAAAVDQTTAGQDVTLPNPTKTTASRRFYLENVGSADFTAYGTTVQAGAWIELIWNGATWTANVGSNTSTAILLGGGVSVSGYVFLDSGGAQVSTINGGSTDINTDTTGSIQIDTGTTGAINIGAGTNAKPIVIGNATGGTSLALLSGTGGVSITSTASADLNVGAGGALSLGANATAHTTVVGSGTGASATTIQSGTGAMNIGANSAAHIINIGNGVAGTAITVSSGSTIDIGTNAIAQTVTIGSVTGASRTDIRAGTGSLRIVNNGATWQWPTALGAAGTKLTDAAGNGILSWT